jgi:glutaminyl-peptide cyclotransferase
LRSWPVLLIFALVFGLAGVALIHGDAASVGQRVSVATPPAPQVSGVSSPAQRLGVEVLSVRPHDRAAFTQGLLLHNGLLYESTGLVGESSVREVDPISGAVLRRVAIDPPIFAEGLARVDDRLIQLTWLNGVAFVYDLVTLNRMQEHRYTGEGWGLCYDGTRLVMSDGSSQLFFRDPTTFDLIGQVAVTRDGQPVARLNELECVGDDVYANVWQTDEIVRVERESGRVLASIDASGLMSSEDARARSPDDVLNGIAYDPDAGTFLITGKRWPTMYEVRFVPKA